ncbi:MAG TPA: hypothetical protein VM487_02365, partial [Phycisphaerae bacterium]|nr:hypothetical protein [Phycisphaerae bacterium]
VFYVTLDGDAYGVPYLMMNAAGDGPHTILTTQDQADLNFLEYEDLGGIFADVTQEMPTENFPPRPMRSMAYVNGRIYGILMTGGAGSGVDFDYVSTERQRAGIVYSAAASDMVERDFVGNPEESWPFSSFTPTPNAETPLRVAAAPDGERVLVVTPTSTFLVREAVDGLHEWKRVSPVHGIGKAESLVEETPYGTIWVTQRNEIVLLPPDSDELRILSYGYQPLLSGKTVRLGYYVLDPLNEVDQYRAVLSDGTCVIHDFAIGGRGYTATVHDYTAAATLTDRYSVKHHLVAKQHLYTQEGQPEDGLIVTYDEDYTGPTTKRQDDFSGTWVSQWKDFGDSNLRKELPHLDVIGDARMQVAWYADHESVSSATKKSLAGQKTPQSDTDNSYRFKLSQCQRFWYKFDFTLRSNYQTQNQYRNPGQQDDMRQSLYGAIARVLTTVSGIGGNRP